MKQNSDNIAGILIWQI